MGVTSVNGFWNLLLDGGVGGLNVLTMTLLLPGREDGGAAQGLNAGAPGDGQGKAGSSDFYGIGVDGPREVAIAGR